MALEGAALRNAVRFVDILRNTETYSNAQMQAYQRRLLDRLLRHAKAEVPFYKKRLNPLFGPNDEIRWEVWEDIPTFTRADALEAGDALYARNTPPQVGNYVTKTTSGSTGMPLSIRVNALTSIMSAALNQRIFDWHNIDTDTSIAFIFDLENANYPDGTTGKDWNLRNQEAVSYQLSIACSVSQQVEWLTRKKPCILCTFPQNARALVEEMLEENTPISFETVIVHGEVLDIETKDLMTQAGIQIIDRFGGEDVRSISASCPAGEGHHQFSEVGLFEVSDETSTTTVDLKRGPLIATPFYNYAMPLIRYENGDFIEISTKPCTCGRTLPHILKILGRDRNVFTFSDGTKMWPDLTRDEYAPFLPAKQFQVIQHTRQSIEFFYVPDGTDDLVNETGFRNLLRGKLHTDIEIKLTPVTQIERGPSGKYELWKTLV